MSTFVMGQPFYGASVDGAVDYTNPYLSRGTEYYRNPYSVYSPPTAPDTDRRYKSTLVIAFGIV